MSVQVADLELERLEGLWADGLSETYRSYLDAVTDQEPGTQPKLALAAALIEVGVRLQGLGGRAVRGAPYAGRACRRHSKSSSRSAIERPAAFPRGKAAWLSFRAAEDTEGEARHAPGCSGAVL